MAAWARTFAAHTNIKTVKMIQNGIRQEGIARVLRDGLRHSERLEVLDLQDNTFTKTGSLALAAVLPKWGELREVGVGDCLLSPRGGILVGEALGRGGNEKLEVLRLQYNDITSKGLKVFADAAKVGLKALRRVELNGNRFDEEDEGLVVIREVLDERREGRKVEGKAEVLEWGIDSLSDLEEESDEEEDGDEDEENDDEDGGEEEKKAEKVVKEAEEAENEPVAQEKDKDVDGLADKLAKAEI